MPNSHQGRTVIVTGAASGLGPAYARRFAAGGADLVLVDLQDPQQVAGEVEALGRKCLSHTADVSDPDAVASLAAAVEEFGGAQILLNNVGISPYTPFEEIPLEEWRQVMRINLDSLLLMCQAFVPTMKRAGWGRIINVSSGVGWENDVMNMVHYTTSKLGVVGFTRALATELGPTGITVNAISPGLVRTPNLEQRTPPETFEAAIGKQAIKRAETPEDLAGVASFLASEEAGFVTGQTISVDGGVVRL